VKPLLDKIPQWYAGENPLSDPEIDDRVKLFCKENEIESAFNQIRKNAASFSSFHKKFFQWFNAFRFMKYLHFMRQFKDCEDVEVGLAFGMLLEMQYSDDEKPSNPEEMLSFLRLKDKSV